MSTRSTDYFNEAVARLDEARVAAEYLVVASSSAWDKTRIRVAFDALEDDLREFARCLGLVVANRRRYEV